MWFPQQKKAKTTSKKKTSLTRSGSNSLKEEIVFKGLLSLKINTTKTTNTNSNENFRLKPRFVIMTDSKLKIYKNATDSNEEEVR